jgi:hypothetical protein
MSRLRLLAANPRLALGALLTLLLAAAAVVGSGADFTASSANPANTFAAGTLTISNSKEGAAVLSASGLKPGNSATGTVDIENTGDIDGVFSIASTITEDTTGALSPSNPFAPAAGEQQRSTERELQVKAKIGAELPLEPELERWFPLWGIPV